MATTWICRSYFGLLRSTFPTAALGGVGHMKVWIDT
jgi:hypothetical protein